MTLANLPKNRLETELTDKKPLYTEAEAKTEADRCLYCVDAPCIKACPTEIDIPTFIKKIASGNVGGSARTIFEQNLLGYSCARVCPVEVLCQGDCVYTGWGRDPIQIGRLQRFATETATAPGKAPVLEKRTTNVKKKVACIGGGPASLAFAGYLALEGHDAVVFEKRAYSGGLNTTGIAPYKLHAHDALHEVGWVEGFGVDVQTGIEVGESDGPGRISVKKLLDSYDAVFIGVGLGADSKLGIAGEDGPGVYGATEWIEQMKLDEKASVATIAGKRVIVVGGGNTAIDVARECALLGAADVSMCYRRGTAEMSGYAHELGGGRKEGVRLVGHVQPVEFIRDGAGQLEALRVAKTDADAKPIPDTEFEIPCDMVALAIGQSKLREIAKLVSGIELDKRGCVVVSDASTCATGNPKVFAGGDCINGGKEVVNAVADGRNAARHLITRWS